MPVTNFFGNEILNYNFIGTSYTPWDVNGNIFFGLSTTQVTAQDNMADTVTEPADGAYGRISVFNKQVTINLLGIFLLSDRDVELLVDDVYNLNIGDVITVTGVDAFWGITNVDGTWTLTSVGGGPPRLYFTVDKDTTGPSPQALSQDIWQMDYSGSDVTLWVADTNHLYVGDTIIVSGVDSGFGTTNIDGTWVIASGGGGSIQYFTFTVSSPPTGTAPQTLTAGTVTTVAVNTGEIYPDNWSISTDGSLYNNRQIEFPSGSIDWTIVSIFIADSSTQGVGNSNVLAFYTMPTPFIVPSILFLALPPKSIRVSLPTTILQPTTSPTTCGTLFTINRILNYNFGGHIYTPDDGASKLWFGLSTTVVDNTGLASVTEPLTADNYSRQGYLDSNWNASTGVNPPSGVTNNAPVYFSTPTTTWGEIRSLFVSDSATRAAGNVLWYKTLSPSIYVPFGMVDVFFNPGEITFDMI